MPFILFNFAFEKSFPTKADERTADALGLDPNSEEFLRSVSIGDHDGDFTSNRMRMFGGTSSVWGGNCNPMNISNFKKNKVSFSGSKFSYRL